MHSNSRGFHSMNNNDFKYTSAVLVDNGPHYHNGQEQVQRDVKKKVFSEMGIHNTSKNTKISDVLYAQSVFEWPSHGPKSVYDIEPRQTVQKKTRPLLPFVHMCSENRSVKMINQQNRSLPINKITNNNNEMDDDAIQQVFPTDVQYITLSPFSSPKEVERQKSPNPKSFPVEQHYEYYYSYFYNRQSNQQERKVRKLPDTRAMAAAKKFSGDHLVAKHQPLKNHETNVLREKINNNNVIVCDDEAWRLQEDNKHTIGDIGDIKDDGSTALGDTRYNVAFARTHFDSQPNGTADARIYRPAKSKVSGRACNQGESASVEVLNTRQARLPLTPPPSHIKISETTPKKSPSPRPRVLLYNQSPRLGRSTVHTGVRLQEWRRTHLMKSPSLSASNKIKKRYLSGLVHSNRAMNADSYVRSEGRSSSPVTVGRRFTLGTKPLVDAEVSSDNDEGDDDFDNVSNPGSDISASSSDEDGYRVYAYRQSHTIGKNYSALSSLSPSITSETSDTALKNPQSLLAPSLFPNVPPYLAFSSNTCKGPSVPPELYRILKWRISNVMPKVVRHILSNSGMRLLKKTNDWMGVWGKHLKSPCFRTIRPYQKINHLPGSFKIGRKDSLWRSLLKHSLKHGKKDFGFMPKTYIIPHDLGALRKAWPRYASKNVKWIIKPPASARGAGIRVVSKWAQIPKRRPLIVQKYIERPLLINGSKFDLRLYVLVTSINPLRVYLYHNGLARFASVKYSDRTDTLHDRCMHLTNYSINKLSSNYAKNEDVNACHGHKWTIKSLWNYLASRGVHTDFLWDRLRALVLRTLLVGESSINNMIRMNVESKYSVYELFGFDILLDSDLIPWLLEVNISPSLHSELPLDAHVKAPLVQAVLNTALYNIPPKLSLERQREIAEKMSYHMNGSICYDKRMYINYLSRVEKVKHNTYTRKTLDNRQEYLDSILEELTPDDVRCLIVAEDELSRCAPLERIFPTTDSHLYLKYYDTPRYYNRLLDAWETRYGHDRKAGISLLTAFCMSRFHLQVPQAPVKKHVTYRTQALRMPKPKRSGLFDRKGQTPSKVGTHLRAPFTKLSTISPPYPSSEEDEESAENQ